MPLLSQPRSQSPDPQIDWTEVSVDLARCCCQGVALGQAPAAGDIWRDTLSRGDRYVDRAHGVELATELGLLDFIGIDVLRFPGRFLLNGDAIELGPGANEQHVTRSLGDPWWRDESDQLVRLFFEGERFERQFELAANGLLLSIGLFRTPVMANSAQRRAYGVSKSWPPSR